jgi:hypothetical protein
MRRWILGLERRQSYRQEFPCGPIVYFFPASGLTQSGGKAAPETGGAQCKSAYLQL